MLPRKDYHVYITRSTYHYAYARQTQVNRKKINKEKKREKRKEYKTKQRKRKRKEKTRHDKTRQDNKRKQGKEKGKDVIPADGRSILKTASGS